MVEQVSGCWIYSSPHPVDLADTGVPARQPGPVVHSQPCPVQLGRKPKASNTISIFRCAVPLAEQFKLPAPLFLARTAENAFADLLTGSWMLGWWCRCTGRPRPIAIANRWVSCWMKRSSDRCRRERGYRAPASPAADQEWHCRHR